MLSSKRSWVVGVLVAGGLVGGAVEAQKVRPIGERVRVYYDQKMVPHIVGESDEAALYGLGWHHMMEYPVGTLNMLWLYSGRMAEVAGNSYIDEDRLARLWELPAIAKRHKKELEEARLLPLIEAYVQGVNDGRRWWREKAPATAVVPDQFVDARRYHALLGSALEIHLDPVPDYLNPAFSPFGEYDDPGVPAQMEAVLARLMSAEMDVNVAHVLKLGAVINSFFLYAGNSFPIERIPTPEAAPERPELDVPRPPAEARAESLASNGWLVAADGPLARTPLTFTDTHIAWNRITLRPYVAQVWGDRYRATGLTMPGYPAVYLGYNDHVSWLFTAPPNEPVVRNKWRVTLADTGDVDALQFPFQSGLGITMVALQKVQEPITVWDPETGETSAYQDERYYVPVQSSEGALGFTRYPVIPEDATPPLPGEEIVFHQAAFTTEGNFFEFCLRMGRARNVRADMDAALAGALSTFGKGLNTLAADTDGYFRYLYMARFPIQGPDVAPEDYVDGAELDGASIGSRWQGFHALQENPAIGPVDVTDTNEVWINNNATPDKVETLRFDEEDLLAYPAYMVSHESLTTWRQVRAEELLRNSIVPIDEPTSTLRAVDRHDTWLAMMWPYFEFALERMPLAILLQVSQFQTWVNEFRSHDQNDQPDPRLDFEAHPFSQVMVYATLLRSHYLDELRLIQEGGVVLNAKQAEFGFDPEHVLFTNPDEFTFADYGPNMLAMKAAFETVAALWIKGTGTGGLANQATMAALSPELPGDPWGDPRYGTDIAPHWAGIIGGQKVTRWGHVNVVSLTPHLLRPPKRSIVESGFAGQDPLEVIRAYFFSAVDPDQLDGLPYDNLKIPFYQPEPWVRPVGGTDESLFLTHLLSIFQQPAPLGYQESLYRWSGTGSVSDHLFYELDDAGSQALLSVDLRKNAASPSAAGRFMAVTGATEITRADLLGDGSLAYQQRNGPTQAFSNSVWTTLFTDASTLGRPRYDLCYVPLEQVETQVNNPPAPRPAGVR